jgi:hypothetical protein
MEFVDIRHQVAIAGQVTDAQTGQVLRDAQVTVRAAPATFIARLIVAAKAADRRDDAVAKQRATLNDPEASAEKKLAAAQAILDHVQQHGEVIPKRSDQTQTAVDGIFYFLDLPPGVYMFIASQPGFGTRYGTVQTTVAVTHTNGNINMATVDIALPPTTLKGQITGPSLDDGSVGPVLMAQVQVKGSGESTFSDSKGQYLLAGLETGPRTVRVSAQGYQGVERTVEFTQAGTERIVNIALASSTP